MGIRSDTTRADVKQQRPFLEELLATGGTGVRAATMLTLVFHQLELSKEAGAAV